MRPLACCVSWTLPSHPLGATVPPNGERTEGGEDGEDGGEWGTAHQVRLVWLVKALVDVCEAYEDGRCTRYEEMNDARIIHTYDDDWTLTGLDVREEHGTDYDIIYCPAVIFIPLELYLAICRCRTPEITPCRALCAAVNSLMCYGVRQKLQLTT